MTTSTFASRILALVPVVRRRSFPTQAKRRLEWGTRLSFASGLLLAVFALAAASAHAQTTYTVTDLTDNASDTGSIRYAVNEVNKGTGGDTIVFSGVAASGTITLNSANGTLTLNKNVTITGTGAGVLTISGGGAVTVFTINSGVTVSISGLTIADGNGTSGSGILNNGTLNINNSALSNNVASVTTSSGGGIDNGSGSTLTVSNSTFSGNYAGSGGGILNFGTMTVSNSTFNNNSSISGGGIFNSGGTSNVINSTIAGNTSSNYGGGIYVASGGGSVTITNSIVSGNTEQVSGQTGNDCYQCGTQSSNNLISTSSSSPSPALGSLQYNGGPTQTMMPQTSSPAINAGLSSIFSTDQRGFPRPTGSGVVSDLGAVQAGDLTVTTLSDNPHSGTSCTNGAVCSLRDAIGLVNSQGSGDIFFAPTLKGTITLTSALPAIPSTVTAINISGPGANVLTVSGDNKYQVFNIDGQTANLSGLTVANGNSSSNSSSGGGGGIFVGNSAAMTVSNSIFSGNTAVFGGGIYSTGIALTVSNSAFIGNSVSGGSGSPAEGGGINNGGTLTVSNSTFSGNTASGSFGSTGGGIFNGGTLTVSNSTFSGNTASGSSSAFAEGGGIYSYSGSALTVSDSTLSGNSATNGGSGGGIYNGGTATITNSIVAGNTESASGQAGNDCGNCGTQSKYNLISTSAAPITAAQLMLGPLALNGPNQTLQTLLPLPGSPAIEAGNPALLPSSMKTDERGRPRTVNSTLDLGAVETDYTAVQFVQQPTNTLINATITPAVTLRVMESGAAAANIPVPLTLTGNGTLAGTLTETTLVTTPGTAAVATYGNLSVNTAGTGDTLGVTLPITPAGAATPLTLTATSNSFDITLQTTTITWTTMPPTSVTYGAAPITLAATDNSGATVQYQVISGPAMISGSTLSFTGVGAVEIEAYTNASGSYNSGSLTANITVNPATLTVTANNATRAYGTANPTFTGTVTGAVNGDTFTESFSTTATTGSAVGTYPITPMVTGAHLSDYTVTTVSGTLTIVAAPASSYALAATPTSLTITPGQTGSSSLTITPSGGYTGKLTLVCAGLPVNAYCAFSQNAGAQSQVVTISGSASITVPLSIETSVATAPPMARMQAMPSPFGPQQSPLSPILPALAFWWPGSMAGLAAFGRRKNLSKARQRMVQLCLLVLMTGALAAGISGCGGSSSSTPPATTTPPTTHNTPAGTSNVIVTATPASGGASQSVSITLTIS